jgi:hypothetical protein
MDEHERTKASIAYHDQKAQLARRDGDKFAAQGHSLIAHRLRRIELINKERHGK